MIPLDVATNGYISSNIPIGCATDGYIALIVAVTRGGSGGGGGGRLLADAGEREYLRDFHRRQVNDDENVVSVVIAIVLSGKL